MKNFFKPINCFFVINLVTILLIACPHPNQFPDQNGMVTVAFSVYDNSASTGLLASNATNSSPIRTVLPEVNVTSYTLLGGRNGAEELLLAEFNTNGTSISLESGVWNFTLNAFNQNGEHILQGFIKNRQINLTGPNQVSFPLSTISSGIGVINITFNFPETADITRISTSGDMGIEEFTPTSNGSFIYTKNEATAGDYFINFNFYSGDVLKVVISELVLVRSNLTSRKTITLVGNDLKIETFTVTFVANGGTPQPAQQLIISGNKISEPPIMYKSDENLIGWYKEASFINQWDFSIDIVTENIILYAKWGPPIIVSGVSFAAKMRWLELNAQSGGSYVIEFDTNDSISSIELSFNNRTDITIILKSAGGTRKTLSLNTEGSMFTITPSVTLILCDDLDLRGSDWNTGGPLIRVNYGANLIMNNGVRIIDNCNRSYSLAGGGVHVAGTFIMNGGEISGNSSNYMSNDSGGVFVASNASFTMNDGKISENSSTSGGIFISNNASFTMINGEISNNTSTSNYAFGGGIHVVGSFIMEGGEISNNTTRNSLSSNGFSRGGGVYVANNGNFIMNTGKITNNTSRIDNPPGDSDSSGGGVFVAGIFTMNGGEISGNSAIFNSTFFWNFRISSGGGVYVTGSFFMRDGEIRGNTASTTDSIFPYGGGVYIAGSIFEKTGGIIFGYSDGDNSSNVVRNSSGITQENHGHAIHIHNGNSIYIMGKNSISMLGDNLSFNGFVNPPIWSGNWDY